jgi:hypothetical protein
MLFALCDVNLVRHIRVRASATASNVESLINRGVMDESH